MVDGIMNLNSQLKPVTICYFSFGYIGKGRMKWSIVLSMLMIVSVEWRCLKILSPLKNNWRSSTCWQMISTRMFSFFRKCTMHWLSLSTLPLSILTLSRIIPSNQRCHFQKNYDWFLYEAILSKKFTFWKEVL